MDRTINVILKPLRRFAMQKPNASILLFMAMILAMLFANSPWAESYHNILSHPIDLKIGNFTPFMHHGEVMPGSLTSSRIMARPCLCWLS